MRELILEISKAKMNLEGLAKQIGLFENFGQKEVIELKDKFINISDFSKEMNSKRRLIAQFDNWCMNFTP